MLQHAPLDTGEFSDFALLTPFPDSNAHKFYVFMREIASLGMILY